MTKRNKTDAEIDRVVGAISFPSQEGTLIEMSKNWSQSDAIFAIERLEIGIVGVFRVIEQRLMGRPVRGQSRSRPSTDRPQPLRKPVRVP